jgi:hypothetical protein
MDLYYSIPIAFGFIGVRYIFNQFIHSFATGEKSKVDQISESCFKGIYHTTAFCIGYNYVLKEDLLNNIQLCWINLERQHIFDYYYIFELSWYIHELICHFFTERKKDHLAMLIHHVATITLIVVSYHYNLLFMGALTVTIHNLSDIFLHSVKIGLYIQSDLCSSVCAALLFVSWIYSRLYIFPVFVIHSTLNDTLSLVEYYQTFLSHNYVLGVYYTMNSALITLFILHIFWFRLICLSIFRKFDGKQIEDVREKND